MSDKRRNIVGTDQMEFSPGSLVGSWFHRIEGYDEMPSEQGLVVAEPQPGIYLLETLDWDTGQVKHQRLSRLDQMLTDDEDWRFYDTDQAMRVAFDAIHAKLRQEA